MGFINILFLLNFLFYASYKAIGVNSSSCSIINTIYQFGDSIADTGNLIRLVPNLPPSKPPYGETYPGSPTGRWSDGRLLIDYEVEAFGLAPLEPYFLPNASFKNGVNFAIAGSTAVNTSILLSRFGITSPPVSDISSQITLFTNYLVSNCSTKTGCSSKLNNSLIFFGAIGVNDIRNGFFSKKTIKEMRLVVPFIVQTISDNLKQVISLGASNILVPGLYPIGCVPSVITSLGASDSKLFDAFGCNIAANHLAMYHNTLLRSAVANLRFSYPTIKITYLDHYHAFTNLLISSPIYGFDSKTLVQACCGTGDYNTSSPRFCTGPGVPVCANPSQYISWDGYHLTQAANTHVVDFLLPTIKVAVNCFST